MASRPISTGDGPGGWRMSSREPDGIQCRGRPDRAKPRGRARREDGFHRRSRALQLCRARRTGEPICQSRAPARHPSRAAHPPLPPRHDRFPDRLSRRDQGRGRSGRGQHSADRRRIRLHAGRQPRPRGRRVGAGAAGHGGGIGRVAGAAARVIVSGGDAESTRSPACWRRRRPRPTPRRRIRTSRASGSIRRARPAGRRAPSTSIRA